MLEYPSSALPKAGTHRRIHSAFVLEDSRSSSLQKIWAEDFVADERSNNSQNQFEDIIAHPAPATLTERPFPKSIPLTYDEEQAIPRQRRTHQRSLTTLLPFRNSRTSSTSPQRSPQKPPEKGKLDFEFMPTLTGDKDGQIRIEDKSKGGLGGWFSGTSNAMAVGIPIDEAKNLTALPSTSSFTRNASPERVWENTLRQPTLPYIDTIESSAKPAITQSSRFPFFSPKPSPPRQAQIPSGMFDELLTVDIRHALLPTGENDPFSPSAFKNLLTNAEGLLNKMQAAYKLRTLSLHELVAEKEAQADELEEAETRAKHLKMQLGDMAQRVMAHDEEMQKVLGELAKERQARTEEQEAREKSISLIKFHPVLALGDSSPQLEDLEVDTFQRRRTWRRSDGTVASETSFESDDESGGADSIFSRSMSPSLAVASEVSAPEMGQAVFAKLVSIRPTPKKEVIERPKPVQQRSTFQKILYGTSTTAVEEDSHNVKRRGEDELGTASEGCHNCCGGPSSVAWLTVDLLRAENRGLKERMSGLETAVEGALDLVNGLGRG